jgi:protein-S-isoprenylcysteine O-methyltransferase Ste14
MYVGLSLAYLGEAALLRQVWPAVLLPLTLIYLQRVVIPLEETRLRETFGPVYTEYCARVRRWL